MGGRRPVPASLPAAQRHPALSGLPREQVPVVSPCRAERLGVHRGPPPWWSTGRLPGAVVDGGRGPSRTPGGGAVRLRLLRRRRQDRPRAWLRRRSTTPSCGAADQLVADLLDVLPPGAALIVTADHGQVQVGDNIITPSDGAARRSSIDAVRRGAVPVAARSTGSQSTTCWRPPRPNSAAPRWVRSTEQMIDEGWFGPTVAPTGPAPTRATWRSWRREPVQLTTTRPTAGRSSSSCRHGSLTSAEMHRAAASRRFAERSQSSHRARRRTSMTETSWHRHRDDDRRPTVARSSSDLETIRSSTAS